MRLAQASERGALIADACLPSPPVTSKGIGECSCEIDNVLMKETVGGGQ